MAIQTLEQNLDRLREQLEQAHDLDPETQRELVEIAETIDQVLQANDPDYQAAHRRIEHTALEFEARHPRFARILSDVTDALAKLGL